MGSIQQSILSLQVQFNSLYAQIENIKKVEANQIVFSQEQKAAIERIEKKVSDVRQVAERERAGTVTKIVELKERVQTFGACLRSPVASEQMGALLERAKGIKQTIQEIYLAHFNVAQDVEQNVQVNALNDEDMAGNDWIVERACKEAKTKYPLTCTFLSSCVKEIASEKHGKELKDALEMCLPSIWSIESLLKLSIISMIVKSLPLKTVDCIPLTDENEFSFFMLSMELLDPDKDIMQLLLLHADNAPAELTQCITMLNRFVNAATINRKHALGLMNLIRGALNETNVQDRLEDLLRKNRRDEAVHYARTLPQQSQRAGAYVFLIQQATTVEMLEQMHQLIRSLSLEETRDDLYKECANRLLDRFPDQYRKAVQFISKITYWEVKNSLYQRLAKQVMFSDPAFCLEIFKSNFKDDTLLNQFITFHSAREFDLSCQAIELYRNQDARKEALQRLPETLKWVKPGDCKAVSSKIQALMKPIKSKILLSCTLIEAFSKTHPLIALHLALEASDSPTLNRTVSKISHAIDNIALGNPQVAYQVAYRFQKQFKNLSFAPKIITGAVACDPLLAIQAYAHFALLTNQLTLEPIKQVMWNVDCTKALPLLQKMDVRLASRDELLLYLVSIVKESHPVVAFQAMASLNASQVRNLQLNKFYDRFAWNNQKAVLDCLTAILERSTMELFCDEAIKRVMPIDIERAIQLCNTLPKSALRDRWFVKFALSSCFIDNPKRALELIKMATDPVIDSHEIVERAFAWYAADKETFKKLLANIPSVALRDKVYAELSEKTEKIEPETALDFIWAIKDEKLRDVKMTALAEQLAASNWKKAERFANDIVDPILCFTFITLLDRSETAKKKGLSVQLDVPQIEFTDNFTDEFKMIVGSV